MRRGPRWSAERAGWLDGVVAAASPNFDARPPGAVIDLLVVHHISLPPDRFAGDAIERFFTNALDHDAHPYFGHLRGVQVSAHFLVRRHGGVRQFVSVDERAWHAGASTFLGRTRCNDFAVGIELEGNGERPFTDAQYRKLDMLAGLLQGRLPLRYVAGHSDIAPGRKTDPGPTFDWSRAMSGDGFAGLSRPQVDGVPIPRAT